MVRRVVEETPTIKTLFFDAELDAKPGQFVMIWIPGEDEIPMSLSYIGDEKGITVREVGNATSKLASMKEGDRFGLRGPFGNSFNLDYKRILAVGGGSGIATLAPAIEQSSSRGSQVDMCIGAITKTEILFRERLERSACVHVATDNGSEGFSGFVTELAKELLEKNEYDMVLTCGPEIMTKKMLMSAKEMGIGIQACLERYMKCAMGVCDSCAIGPYLVCRNGPVFEGDKLISVDDFGKFKRDSSGKKVMF
jgi:dihydroorotate dehydrogenase electron transfer subunit